MFRYLCVDTYDIHLRLFYRLTNWNFQKFQRARPEMTRNFRGVRMEHLPHLEEVFDMRIEVFTKTALPGNENDGEHNTDRVE